jgi:chorismate mutase/prephenate dehydrogenase
MGAFLARVFRSSGYPVETMGVGEGASAIEVASRNDLVVVAVPIASTVEVIEQVAPHVRKGACLMDITSIKRPPLEAMLAAAPEGVDVVGTHPMFGPHGADFDRQKVVLCSGRGEAGFARVKRLYEGFGAETIDATAEEHDAQMALIQVLVHEKTMVLGSVLERLKADLGRSLQFASPVYRTELAMIGRMFSQRAELYADILTVNPEAPRLSHVFEQEAAYFARAVAMSDRDAVVDRFRQVADYMKEFATWAKKQSDAILDDLVRHG